MYYNGVLWRGFADHGSKMGMLAEVSGRRGKPLDAEGVPSLDNLDDKKECFDFCLFKRS